MIARILILLSGVLILASCQSDSNRRNTADAQIEKRIDELISRMTVEEKIGQTNQLTVYGTTEELCEKIRNGEIGSLLNVVDPADINTLQRAAVEQSRLGIPLLIARDVIHGFRTVFPIPLGQAATFDPALVEQGARIAAIEASAAGIRWTFSPMLDISRDPRWGRIAESLSDLGHGSRHGKRISGRRCGRPDLHRRMRQALRGLRSQRERPGLQFDQPDRTAAAQRLPTALRTGRPQRRHDPDDLVQRQRRHSLDGQPLPARRGAPQRVGIRRNGRNGLELGRRDGLARIRRRHEGCCHEGDQRRRGHGHDVACLLAPPQGSDR